MKVVGRYFLISAGLLLGIAYLTIRQAHWNYPLFLLLRSGLLLLSALSLLRLLYEFTRLPDLGESLKRGLLALFAVAVLLLGVELIFTFVPVSHGVGFSYAGKNWRFYYEQRNGEGFRDEEISQRDTTKQTIVFIGDSFAEGQGIKNTNNRFAELLMDSLGDCYEKLLLARGGWHTKDQLQQLSELDFAPEVIVFQYYGNDIEGDATAMGYHRQPIIGYADLSTFSTYAVRASYLLNYFYWRKARPYLSHYQEYLISAYATDEIMQQHLSSLLELKDLVNEAGAQMYFLGIPFLQDVKLSEQLYLNRLNSLFDDPERRSYAIDLSAAIQAIPTKDRMVNSNDPHASEAVHQLIAQELAKWIQHCD
ncbi:MAG: SGNH/GDSL hydrolase family protein [Bacteroidota bacterium]